MYQKYHLWQTIWQAPLVPPPPRRLRHNPPVFIITCLLPAVCIRAGESQLGPPPQAQQDRVYRPHLVVCGGISPCFSRLRRRPPRRFQLCATSAVCVVPGATLAVVSTLQDVEYFSIWGLHGEGILASGALRPAPQVGSCGGAVYVYLQVGWSLLSSSAG